MKLELQTPLIEPEIIGLKFDVVYADDFRGTNSISSCRDLNCYILSFGANNEDDRGLTKYE